MAILQKEFTSFHEEIKLGTYDENEKLRKKRDLLVDELKESLKDEKIPETEKKLTFKKFDQGSYAMNTGIKPINDDYDIDVGIIFNITNEEYESKKLKKLIFDKLDKQYNRTVEYNRPCITIKYSDGYHVDLAVYSDNDSDYHISWGRMHSKKNNYWYKSEPKKLKEWVSDVSEISTELEQFRRCVRYLKKWKENNFTSIGNIAPPSIGLTIQARRVFQYKKDEDISTLIEIVTNMLKEFTDELDSNSLENKKTIIVKLPVEPYKDVYYKMSLTQCDNYYKKLDTLLEALEAAQDSDSDSEASKILRKIFGNDFPLVEDTKQSKTKPVVTTGHNA